MERRRGLRRATLSQRRGWWGRRSLSGMLLPYWVEDPTPVVESIRRCGRLETTEAVAPSSEDSWEHFVRLHGDSIFNPDVRGYSALGTPYNDAPGRLASAAPAAAQAAYEAERAEREAEYRAESDRQWRQAERRRQIAAARRADEFARQSERERLDVVARLGLTEQGELTAVYWQTDALYRVEGARRVLKASRG
jgi:hypothetical protein